MGLNELVLSSGFSASLRTGLILSLFLPSSFLLRLLYSSDSFLLSLVPCKVGPVLRDRNLTTPVSRFSWLVMINGLIRNTSQC